jgi:hypothetical protein
MRDQRVAVQADTFESKGLKPVFPLYTGSGLKKPGAFRLRATCVNLCVYACPGYTTGKQSPAPTSGCENELGGGGFLCGVPLLPPYG